MVANKKTGFITLEGIDGSGKSSIVGMLASALRKANVSVELTQEPTKTWLGDAVRRGYKEDISPYSEAFLFLADRATHTDWIKKKIADGNLVISDRYSDSTIAYQAALLHQKLGGECAEYLDYLTGVSKQIILEPDLTILFDVDPEISLKRLGNRTELEKFETLENLRLVRQNYLDIAKDNDRICIIDSTASLDTVRASTFEIIGKRLVVPL
ncbi:MAG: dTMP kinase [Thermoplasmata archaeon]|nr:dTMP kinase [Thermoplasmata archaeon]